MKTFASLLKYSFLSVYRPRLRTGTVSGNVRFFLVYPLFAVFLGFFYYQYFKGVSYVVGAADTLLPSQGINASLSAGVFALALLADALLTLVFSFSAAFATFYQSWDQEMLISMPVKPAAIVGAKLAVLSFSEYLVTLLITAPFFITMASLSQSGAMHWISSVFVFLFMPVIPVCIGALTSLVLVRIIGRWLTIERIQGMFQIFMYAFWISLSVGAQLGTNWLAENISVIIETLTNADLQVSMVTGIYPPIGLAVKGIIHAGSLQGVLNTFIFCGLSAASAGVTVFAGRFIYMKSVMTLRRGGSKGKAMTEKSFTKSMRTSSKVLAVARQDFMTIIRTPVFFFNTYFMYVLGPVIFYASIYRVVEQLGSYVDGRIVLFAVIMLYLFMFSAAMPSCTTFTREGATNWLTRVSPVTPAQQLLGRTVVALVLNALFTATFIILLATQLPLGAPDIILAYLLSLSALMMFALFGAVFDAKKPRLIWDNPNRAVKNSFNLFKVICICMIFIFCVTWLYVKTGSYTVTLIAATSVSVALCAAMTLLFCAKFPDWVRRENE